MSINENGDVIGISFIKCVCRFWLVEIPMCKCVKTIRICTVDFPPKIFWQVMIKVIEILLS